MEGCIFNIQKFSLHDGPGIRSVVFFKGCPLRCKWCSNPESQNFNIEVVWDKSKCTKCLQCVKNGNHQIECIDDAIVATYDENTNYNILCPNQALKVEGRKQNVESIVDEVMKDEMFYEESGGGVTLSGGEALSQSAFAIALCKALKQKGVHIAIETTGFASSEVFQAVIENVDLLLFDIKNYDTIKHEQACGVANAQIITNMKYAAQQGKKIIARIPVIPDYNDTLSDALAFARVLKSIGITQVNLLPFHQLGASKYELLGMEYTMQDTKQLHPEDLQEYKEVMIKEGLDCFI